MRPARQQSVYQKRIPGPGLSTMSLEEFESEGLPTRPAPLGRALCEIARQRENVVAVTADLYNVTDLNQFVEEFPDRFHQMGISEQAMACAAAGMAREGDTVFATTYAAFASRRAYDFIYQAVVEEQLDVKIIGAVPGLTTGYGPTHMAAEDIAAFRAIPDFTIVDPCDALDTEQATRAIAEYKGPVYMRIPRFHAPVILDDYGYEFELGKAKMIREGNDVLFISTGLMTTRALLAAQALEKENIDCAVLHVPTIKPLDTETIVEACRKSGRMVVTAENHTVIGGLGDAVASALMENQVMPNGFRKIGIPDLFVDAGTLQTLHNRYGLSVEAICTQIKAWL
ncbi:transketolase C-terminal domain-containing protein [Terasakiella sp. SH-1]|uniref:transketolase family protein n=1 Tax=Terasakiella sp. SH-1 TaxID=2560057 RepID=UPI001F113D55|nr:transketolase C-terminal domain-containing protein [Terasakiella sp. SH-1]